MLYQMLADCRRWYCRHFAALLACLLYWLAYHFHYAIGLIYCFYYDIAFSLTPLMPLLFLEDYIVVSLFSSPFTARLADIFITPHICFDMYICDDIFTPLLAYAGFHFCHFATPFCRRFEPSCMLRYILPLIIITFDCAH